jgi:hypothetical protein
MAGGNHRDANAGRWRDESVVTKRGEPVVVGHADDLEDDLVKRMRIAGRRYALARSNGKYAPCDGACTHRSGSLAGGVLIDWPRPKPEALAWCRAGRARPLR